MSPFQGYPCHYQEVKHDGSDEAGPFHWPKIMLRVVKDILKISIKHFRKSLKFPSNRNKSFSKLQNQITKSSMVNLDDIVIITSQSMRCGCYEDHMNTNSLNMYKNAQQTLSIA